MIKDLAEDAKTYSIREVSIGPVRRSSLSCTGLRRSE